MEQPRNHSSPRRSSCPTLTLNSPLLVVCAWPSSSSTRAGPCGGPPNAGTARSRPPGGGPTATASRAAPAWSTGRRAQSPPRDAPRRRVERRVVGMRVSRRWGPARIAYRLRMQPSTVHKILRRYGCPPLAWTDPATGVRIKWARRKVHSYVHDAPGDLVHVDIKKLGRIPDGGGHKVLGRQADGKSNRQRRGRLLVHPQRRRRLHPARLQRAAQRRTQGDRRASSGCGPTPTSTRSASPSSAC